MLYLNDILFKYLGIFCCFKLIAGSLESANSSILAARNLFKDFGGEKIRIYDN